MNLEGYTINIGNREGIVVYTTIIEEELYAVLSFSEDVKDTEVYHVLREEDELLFRLEHNNEIVTIVLEKLTASTLDESEWA